MKKEWNKSSFEVAKSFQYPLLFTDHRLKNPNSYQQIETHSGKKPANSI